MFWAVLARRLFMGVSLCDGDEILVDIVAIFNQISV